MFRTIQPTDDEIRTVLPGDAIVPNADVIMDTAFSLPATPEDIWPWIVQLGKHRAGWYFSRRMSWIVLPSGRGLRHIDPRFQSLKPGDVIDDWGGKDATFTAVTVTPSRALVYESQRGKMHISWAITLLPEGAHGTRMHFRLRLTPVKYRWLARTGGAFIDKTTIAWLAAGLRERVNSVLPPKAVH